MSPRRPRRAPRIYDVARSAGVSIATVSRVANATGTVRPGTAARVRAAMRRLRYRPHPLARGLAAQRSRTIGLLISDIQHPYFADIVRGAQARAELADHAVLLGDVSLHTARPDLLVQRLLQRRVDGLIVASDRTTADHALHLRNAGVPVVSINGSLEHFPRGVRIDDGAGTALAIDHLVALGHRRIAHVAGPVGTRTREERIRGYRAALRAAGLRYDADLVATGAGRLEESRDAAARLLALPDPPTAFFAYNDRGAIGCYHAIRAAGLRVGADVSVVGFDDIDMARWIEPALTTIHQPRAQMGEIAVDLLLAEIEGRGAPQHVVMPPRLVVRSSTARAPAGRERGRP